MYGTLREWLNIPVQIIPCVSKDGAGDSTFGPAINTFCYAVAKNTKVVNASGSEVVSTTTLYLDGSETIHSDDDVIFGGLRPIKAIGEFFEKGQRSMWVVYL